MSQQCCSWDLVLEVMRIFVVSEVKSLLLVCSQSSAKDVVRACLRLYMEMLTLSTFDLEVESEMNKNPKETTSQKLS